MNFPEDLKYTREHEWARVDGTRAVIGITRFAVEQLGDITQVDLPKEGDSVKKDEVFGTVAAQLNFPRDSVRRRVRERVEPVVMMWACRGDSASVVVR